MADLVVEDVAEGVACIRRRSYLNCSYLVRRGERLVLVDTGMRSDASDVVTGLAHLGAGWDDVSDIVLTHWHSDHSAGAHWSQRRCDAVVHCGAADIPYLRRETRRPGIAGAIGDRWPERGPLVLAKGVITNAPKLAVDGPTAVTDGDLVAGLRILATPGHTAGHVSVWDEERGILFAGDALAVRGGRIHHMARPVTLDREAAKGSMSRLLDLGPDLICPGHRRPLRPTPSDLADARRRVADLRWPLFG